MVPFGAKVMIFKWKRQAPRELFDAWFVCRLFRLRIKRLRRLKIWMRKMRTNINSLFQVISAESFKAASANESKRSSISEPFENEIIPRSIHALVDKKTKEFITKVFYKVITRTLSAYLFNIEKKTQRISCNFYCKWIFWLSSNSTI